MEVCTGLMCHAPDAFVSLGGALLVRIAEQQVGARVVVPAFGDRDVLLVVGQRKARLLLYDRSPHHRIGDMGATSASSHQSVQRGSLPFTAIGRRSSSNSGKATGVGPVRSGSAASTKTEPVTG